jgi:hypothetical protein
MDLLDAEGFRIFCIQKVFYLLDAEGFRIFGYRRFSYLWNRILAGEAMADEDGRWNSIDDRWWIIMRWRRVHRYYLINSER